MSEKERALVQRIIQQTTKVSVNLKEATRILREEVAPDPNSEGGLKPVPLGRYVAPPEDEQSH